MEKSLWDTTAIAGSQTAGVATGQTAPVTPVFAPQPLPATPPATPPTQPTATNPPRTPRKRSVKKLLLFVGLGLLLLGTAATVILNLTVQPKQQAGESVASQFNSVEIPLSDLVTNPDIELLGTRSLTVNGRLQVNDALVIRPSLQPSNSSSTAGQIYYDQTTNELAYFNGEEYVSLSGDLATGAGITVVNGQVTNTGVLSFQGQTGDVTLNGGTGITINGTTISNDGVTTVNDLTGDVTIANTTTTANTITINDASTSQKGLAQFDATNFSVSSGTVNTIQGIGTGASPTFAGLTTTGTLTLGGLGTTDTSTQVCRNTSNQLALCQATVSTAFVQDGNSFGATATLGTNDANGLSFEVNNVVVTTISSTGATAFKNQTNSAAAFQVQDTAAAGLLTVDTAARGAGGGNLVKIGNSTGTDTATTILQLDGTTADPTSNLSALNGGMFYNSTTHKVSLVEDGQVKVICNTTDLGCGTGNVTLQDAYDNGNTISTDASGDIAFTLNSSQNFTVTTAAGGTGATTFSLADGANATPPSQLVLVRNADTNQAVAAGISVQAAAGGVTTAFDASGANITNALAIGAHAITGTNFSVTAAGAVTAVGVNAGAGLLQGTLGLTVSGATVSVNNNSNFATNINTGTSNGTVTIGGGSAPLVIDSTALDVTSGGALSGITTISTSSTINSQTISAAANFTGTATIQGANALTLGVTGSATGAILFKGATAASGTITLIGQANPGTQTITLPDATGTVCLTTGNCAGSGTGVTTSGGIANRIAKFSAAQNIEVSTISDDATNVTTSVDLIIQGGEATLGVASSQTGSLLFKHSGSANTGTIVQGALTDVRTYTLPDASGSFCLTSGNCSGSGSSNTLQAAYDAGNSIDTTNNRDIDITLKDFATDANLDIVVETGSTGFVSIARQDGAGAADPAQLLLVKNNDTNRAQPVGIAVQGAAGGVITTAFDASNGNLTNALAIGANAITGTNFSVTGAGAVTAVGVNAGAGLLQGALGLTITGAATSLNNSSNFATNINTGTSNGTVTIGGGSAPLVIDSTAFDVTSGGALSGITTIATSSTINSQTISATANFTGTVTVQGANALTLGVTGTSTGAVLFKGATAASGTITLIGQANPGTQTITLPDATGIVCLTSGNCAGVGGTGDILQNGNSFTANMTIGTNDAFDLNLETTGITRLTVESDGSQVTLASNVDLVLQGATAYISNPQAQSNSEAFGLSASVANQDSLAVGVGATASNTRSIALGRLASAAGDDGIALGYQATVSGNGGIAVGRGTNAGFGSIALGYGATTTTGNQLVVGSNSSEITSLRVGSGVTDATPNGFTLQGTSGSGSNIAGADTAIAAGQGTGSAAGGGVIIQSSAAGGAGSSLNALSTLATLASTGITIGSTALNTPLTLDSGTATIAIGTGAQARTINLGTGAAVIQTINVGGTGANVISIGNTQTAGSISLGAAMTGGTISIGGTGLQTGTIDLGVGTGAQAINLGTGGTGAKTVIVGSTASTGTTTIQGGTGGVNVGTGGIANTVQIGNTTGAVSQTINIGTNATASSTSNVNIGSTVAGTTAIAGTATVNAGANFNTSINTGSSSGTITLGGSSAPLVIDSTAFDVTVAGAVSGVTTLSTSGIITVGALGAADTATTLCRNAANQIATCTGGGAATLQTAYDAGNTITTTDGRNISFAFADTATDANFLIDLQCDTACSTNGRFAIQDDATDVFTVLPAAGGITIGDNTLNTPVTVNSGTGTIAIGTGAQARTINFGTGAAVVQTINIGGTGANVIALGNTQTAGSISLGAAMTTGTINIGGTGLQTGTITIGGGTGAQAIDLATGGTGAKTVTLGSIASTSSLALRAGTGGHSFVAGASTVGTISSTGAVNFINSTDSTAGFNIEENGGGNLFTVDTTNSRVGINLGGSATPTLATSTEGLECQCALRLSGDDSAFRDNYTTPDSSTEVAKVNIVNQTLPQFGNVIALGLTATSHVDSRGLGVYDNRSGNHQPAIAVFSTDEQDAFGLSWEGSTTAAYLKTLGASSSINLRVNNTTDLATFAIAGITIGLANTPVTIDSGTGTIAIGTGAQARTINVGTGAAVQTITVGSSNSTSALTLRAGTGNLKLETQGGTLGIGDNAVAQTINIGNSTGTTVVNIKAGTGNVTIGTSDTTGTLFVLDTKTGSGDPTGSDGAMYYNSSMAMMRCYYDAAWRFCNDPPSLSWGYSFEEDFIHYSDGRSGHNSWQEAKSGTGADVYSVDTTDTKRPGIIRLDEGTAAATTAYANLVVQANGFGGEPVIIGGGEVVETAINISALSDATNEYDIRVGLCDGDNADCVDGAYFEYDRNTSTNWSLVTANNSTRTRIQNSNVACTAGSGSSVAVAAASWIRFKAVVNSGGTQIDYYINGTFVGCITTNIPTARATSPYLGIFKDSTGTTARYFDVDYYHLRNSFTTQR